MERSTSSRRDERDAIISRGRDGQLCNFDLHQGLRHSQSCLCSNHVVIYSRFVLLFVLQIDAACNAIGGIISKPSPSFLLIQQQSHACECSASLIEDIYDNDNNLHFQRRTFLNPTNYKTKLTHINISLTLGKSPKDLGSNFFSSPRSTQEPPKASQQPLTSITSLPQVL